MQGRRLAVSLLAVGFATHAWAQADLCHGVAHHLWTSVAAGPLHEQTPLAQLSAARPASFKEGDRTLAKPGQSIADALIREHAADSALAAKLRDLAPAEATRFGKSGIWLLDKVEGTLGCHTILLAAVPPGAPAHEVDLPPTPDPSALCALSALTAVSVDGTPALWIEQSGAFSALLGQSTVTIVALHDETFAAPCTLTIDYAVADKAAHAFCNGVDCVPLTRTAEVLAMRLRQEETAETLGDGAEDAGYRRMAEIAGGEAQPASLPTFGVSLDTPYTAFSDQVIFPLRVDDAAVYLARLGHAGLGWRQSADTLLALYRLRDDQMVPAASVYVSARRSAIIGVSIQ